jgi:hypothetical protein
MLEPFILEDGYGTRKTDGIDRKNQGSKQRPQHLIYAGA